MNDEKIKRLKRTFVFNADILTCNRCDKCYDQNNEQRFCQEFSLSVDPDDIKGNHEAAMRCKYWIPKGWRIIALPDAPEHVRWYEKDSIG